MAGNSRAGGGVLGEAIAWVRFLAFQTDVRALLEQQAARLPCVSLAWLPASGHRRAAVQIRAGDQPPVLLLIAGVCSFSLDTHCPVGPFKLLWHFAGRAELQRRGLVPCPDKGFLFSQRNNFVDLLNGHWIKFSSLCAVSMHLCMQETLILEGYFAEDAPSFWEGSGRLGHSRLQKEDIVILLHRLLMREASHGHS